MNSVKRLLFSASLVLAASTAPLPAQPLTVLHTFGASSGITNSDGAQPRADLVLAGNTLFGTTPIGGTNGFGTVFSVNTDGTGFTVLHAFTGGADGAVPNKNLVLSSNLLYGTVGRGTNGTDYGSIFSVDTNGNNFSLLYTFATNTSGALGQPNAGLILSGDTLYGTAYQGGITNAGSVFSLNTNGTFNLLHLFTAATDGKNPLGNLVLSGNTLYGTTRNGGTNGLFGTIFSLNANGNNFAVLHTFSGSPSLDGRNPDAGMILSGGTLYGTTGFGGTNGGGTVFSINTDGTAYSILHSFAQTPTDGKLPEASLFLNADALYGTTLATGTGLSGTVFSLNTNGSSYNVLHMFSAAAVDFGNTNSDGSQPFGSLVMSGDVLYGTTSVGGATGMGTVFSVVIAPVITQLNLADPNLTLNAVNGIAGHTYTLLTSTDAGLPIAQWTPLTTNTLATSGDFTITAPNTSTELPQSFYLLQTQ